MVNVIKHWSRLPSEVVYSPSMVILRTQLNMAVKMQLQLPLP